VPETTIDFSTGLTDPASFPTERLAAAAGRAIREVGEDFVLYPGPLGHRGLREAMARRETTREAFDADPEHIALTNGSMQAVTLVGRVFLEQPGDVIVTEELTYPGTIAAYEGLGARLVGVPVDNQGMRVDELERIMQRLHDDGTPPRFIYTLPTYQNPTAAVMPLERRQRLLEIARHFDTIVVEDNCYGDVHFEGEVPPALYALDDLERVVYIGSLSKIFAAGLRLGYLMAKPPLLDRIVGQRFDCGHSVLAASVVAAYLEDHLEEHLERHNRALGKKRDALLQALEQYLGDSCTWLEPIGGLFLWLGLPAGCDLDLLQELSEESGVLFVRGRDFHVDRREIPFLRLAFGYPTIDEIERGIARLADCIRAAVPSVRVASI